MNKKLLSDLVLVALVLGVFTYVKAQDATPTSPTTLGVNLACMQTAVETRDNAIITAWDILTSSIKTALQTRRDALKAAWGISNAKERKIAIKKAWTDFAKTKRAAGKTFNQAKMNDWKQFKTDARACKSTATYETEGNDVKF